MNLRSVLHTARIWLSTRFAGRRWVQFAAPALLLAMTLAFFWKLAFSGLILARGDTFLYFYPYWEIAAGALRGGRVPLWNEHIFMGAPFVANSQVGFFYPLNWPLWLLLPTPYAVSASIVLHLMLAAVGSYLLARKRLQLSVVGALLAAAGFALGGYLTAQVEHVNQLQGLAWLPWLLAVGSVVDDRGRAGLVRIVLLTGIVFALQALAGHTQTLFISMVALLLFRVAMVARQRLLLYPQAKDTWLRSLSTFILVPAGALFVGVLLGAVQLLPTIELAQLSGRQGGLPPNEAVSFSLNPALWSQSLLPRYGESLFTEYVAFMPVVMLVLATIAVWQWRRAQFIWPALVLAAGGLFLALGAYNPLYLLLARLPGIGYFRAPARWLALYALGAPLLAGLGLDMLRGIRGDRLLLRARRALTWAVVIISALIVLGFAAPAVAAVLPVGTEVSVRQPNLQQVLAFFVELALGAALMERLTNVWSRYRQQFVALLLLLSFVVLFAASRSLPANQLTTPAAFFDVRAPVARLLALQNCRLLPSDCTPVPERLLSLSDIFFDPGDLAELEQVYGPVLSAQAFRDFVVAVKQKEIVAPNLPMTYGLASVDGFDGGILPLRNYILLSSLLLDKEEMSSDGRLREHLDVIPEARWLDLIGARFVITDKVGDEWREGVFFDTQHAQQVTPEQEVMVANVPVYEATELWILGDGAEARVQVGIDGAQLHLSRPELISQDLWRMPFPNAIAPASISLMAEDESWFVRGIALVDSRDGTFQTIVPGSYRLLYSGDVKIYENLDVMSRTFLLRSWQYRRDGEAALQQMAADQFDPRREAVVIGEGEGVLSTAAASGATTVVSYGPEEVVVDARLDEPGLLVFTDAYYPGWQVTVDDDTRNLEQVNVLFRGVFLSAGEHEVRFSLVPQAYLTGKWISLSALFVWLGLGFLFIRCSARKALKEVRS